MTPLDAALDRVQREALAPPPVLSLADWADRHARIPIAGNAQPGRWVPFGYQRGWLEAITDPSIRRVTVMKSARVGYTRCLIHAASYYISQDPSPALVVLPRIEDAEAFSRDEILPTLLDTPVLAEIVGDLKSRDANQRMLKRIAANWGVGGPPTSYSDISSNWPTRGPRATRTA
jgi:terminase, large subunit